MSVQEINRQEERPLIVLELDAVKPVFRVLDKTFGVFVSNHNPLKEDPEKSAIDPNALAMHIVQLRSSLKKTVGEKKGHVALTSKKKRATKEYAPFNEDYITVYLDSRGKGKNIHFDLQEFGINEGARIVVRIGGTSFILAYGIGHYISVESVPFSNNPSRTVDLDSQIYYAPILYMSDPQVEKLNTDFISAVQPIFKIAETLSR